MIRAEGRRAAYVLLETAAVARIATDIPEVSAGTDHPYGCISQYTTSFEVIIRCLVLQLSVHCLALRIEPLMIRVTEHCCSQQPPKLTSNFRLSRSLLRNALLLPKILIPFCSITSTDSNHYDRYPYSFSLYQMQKDLPYSKVLNINISKSDQTRRPYIMNILEP